MTVKEKHERFAATREEFARANDAFDQYTEEFRDDVRSKQQLAVAFADEMSATREAFERTATAFETYVDAFEDDVVTKHDAVDAFEEEIERTWQAFEEALSEFETYAEAFDADVGRKRDRVAAFQDEFGAVLAAFEASLAEFEAYAEAFDRDVTAMRSGVDPLLERFEELRERYEEASRELEQSVSEFYGYDAGTEPADSTGDASIAGEQRDEVTDSERATRDEEPADADVEEAFTETVHVGEDHTESPGADAEPMADDVPGTEADEDPPNDMVACLVCGEYYQAITESHLQTHDMSMAAYKEEFGEDVPLYPGEE